MVNSKLHAEKIWPSPWQPRKLVWPLHAPSPRRRWRGRPLRTPGNLPLTAAACTTDQECCCSSVNPPPLKNIHLFSHKRNLFPKVEKESHGTGWRHARHHPGAGFCLSHRGKEGTRPRPGPPQEKSKIKKKNVQIEKTTSVDRIPPLGFLQLWRLTCWVYLL